MWRSCFGLRQAGVLCRSTTQVGETDDPVRSDRIPLDKWHPHYSLEQRTPGARPGEFVARTALMISLVALAMDPLGLIAGVAASVIGSLAACISVLSGKAIGQGYDGTVLPLVGGIALFTTIALLLTRWAESKL